MPTARDLINSQRRTSQCVILGVGIQHTNLEGSTHLDHSAGRKPSHDASSLHREKCGDSAVMVDMRPRGQVELERVEHSYMIGTPEYFLKDLKSKLPGCKSHLGYL